MLEFVNCEGSDIILALNVALNAAALNAAALNAALDVTLALYYGMSQRGYMFFCEFVLALMAFNDILSSL